MWWPSASLLSGVAEVIEGPRCRVEGAPLGPRFYRT